MVSAQRNDRSFSVNSPIDVRRLSVYLLSFVQFALFFERVGPKLVCQIEFRSHLGDLLIFFDGFIELTLGLERSAPFEIGIK